MGFVASSRGVALLCLSVVLEFLAIIFVSLRLWSRKIKRVPLSVNDYAIVVGMILGLAHASIMMTATVGAGTGRHIMTVSPEELKLFGKLYVVDAIVWMLTITIIKISILHLYITIFWNKTFIKCCYLVMGLSIALGVMAILQTLLICRPLTVYWKPTIEHKCGNSEKAYLACHVINMVTDVSIILLPMPVIWNLQMKTSKKIALSIMFGLRGILCAGTLCRLILKDQVSNPDQTYSFGLMECFSVLEVELGTIVACLPLVRPAAIKIKETSAAQYTARLWSAATDSSSPYHKSGSSVSMGRDNQRGSNAKTNNPVFRVEANNSIKGDKNVKLNDLESREIAKGSASFYKDRVHVIHTWEAHSARTAY